MKLIERFWCVNCRHKGDWIAGFICAQSGCYCNHDEVERL